MYSTESVNSFSRNLYVRDIIGVNTVMGRWNLQFNIRCSFLGYWKTLFQQEDTCER
jgi:hypothetical protein